MENKTIHATIAFTDGKTIRLTLDRTAAPISVDNFVKLAKSGFYDGLCFHRVIDGFMIQGGGFTAANGRLTPARSVPSIRGEFSANGIANPLKHTAGVISMARTPDMNSASGQFFICVADTPFLDGQYAAFGKVSDEESLRTAVAIGKVRTTSVGYYDDVPIVPVVMQSVTISEE